MIASRGTRREAAAVLRGAGDLILHRGHEPVPAYRRRSVPRDGAPLDVAGAMCLARFGVHPSIGQGHKQWRLMDPVYRYAYEALLQHVMGHHRSDVCGWNAHVDRARDVVATLWAVSDRVLDRRVNVVERVADYVAQLEATVADGSCPYPALDQPVPVVVVPDVFPREWTEVKA